MADRIPEFTKAEVWYVKGALLERYGREVDVQEADVELRLDPAIPVLTDCPSLVWQENGATFVISKVDEKRFRTQFFYSVREQYGTGRTEYDDLAECVSTVLKLEELHSQKKQERQRQQQ